MNNDIGTSGQSHIYSVKQNTPVQAVLMDLDGTLLDTALDLADVLNQLRLEQGMEPIPFDDIRPWVSHGSQGLLRVGFDLEPGQKDFEALKKRLLDLYQDQLAVKTRLFPTMDQVLKTLENHHIIWGVVTNKPAWLTEPLLEQLNLTERCACVVSGDTTEFSKPHPQPLLHACRLMGLRPEECVYVGDAPRDIEAGVNANMRTLVAKYGYLSNKDQPEQWQADGMLQQPLDLLDWLRSQNTPATN